MQLQYSKINMVTSKGLQALVYSSIAQSRLNANHGPAWEPSRLKFLRTYLLKVMFLQPSCSLMIRQYSPLYSSCDKCYSDSQSYILPLLWNQLYSLLDAFQTFWAPSRALTHLPSSFSLAAYISLARDNDSPVPSNEQHTR